MLFNIFVSSMESGLECPLSNFVDSNPHGAVNMLEGRDTMTRTLERWDCVNLLRFSKAKCKVQHLDHSTPRHAYR